MMLSVSIFTPAEMMAALRRTIAPKPSTRAVPVAGPLRDAAPEPVRVHDEDYEDRDLLFEMIGCKPEAVNSELGMMLMVGRASRRM